MTKLKSLILVATFLAGIASSYLINPNMKSAPPLRLASTARAQGLFQYDYPRVTPCDYRFNMLHRIAVDCGIWPVDCPDISVNGVIRTVPTFNVELNQTQKAALDFLMSDNPCSPPNVPGTKFQVVDLWENQTLIGQKFGLTNFNIWYGNGGSTVYLYFDTTLTAGQKNKVTTEFGKLLVEIQ